MKRHAPLRLSRPEGILIVIIPTLFHPISFPAGFMARDFLFRSPFIFYILFSRSPYKKWPFGASRMVILPSFVIGTGSCAGTGIRDVSAGYVLIE